METREWIIILGVVIGVIILFWLAAHWRKRRYDEMFNDASSSTEPDANQEELEYGSELPSGGARTVGYRDESDLVRMNVEIRQRADDLKPRLSSFASRRSAPQTFFSGSAEQETVQASAGIEQKTQLNLPERSVPLLLDPSDEHSEEGNAIFQPTTVDADVDVDDIEPQRDISPTEVPQQQTKGSDKTHEKPRRKEKLKLKEKGKRSRVESKQADNSEPAEIIMVNLMTVPDAPYKGDSLWGALNDLGMRFGDMDIFHYCGAQGNETSQFRMANLLNPGFFDLDKFDQLRTHALCFFFELDAEQDNIAVYESMLSVINQLKDELGGEIRDDQRSVFTVQTSEHCRTRIRDFQRRRLVNRV